MGTRVGFGMDVHRLETGLTLRIGGVTIPHTKGCVAHSDGDVLIHAICDALLGAAALGDIGYHFPDTDNRYKAINSMLLLERVKQLIAEAGYHIENIDATVAMQTPKLSPHIPAMREAMASVLEINVNQVSVKATTTERLGFEGREEGVSAYAVCALTYH